MKLIARKRNAIIDTNKINKVILLIYVLNKICTNMVPILNHSVFINIKSVITNVIIEIVSDIELDITISL